MAFDQCTADSSSRDEVQVIMARTHRWLKQSLAYHQENPNSTYGKPQALFGIIQGSIYQDLRQECADFVSGLGTDGIAIGGETIGFNMPLTVEIIRWVRQYLPANKSRYTMGVGMSTQDLLDVVAEGIDMFDCVAPTRNARHGSLYSGKIVKEGNWLKFVSDHENGRLQIKKACFAKDQAPIMEDCSCYTCQHHSRSFLHQLIKQKTNLFTALASIHNVHVMHEVCARMRALILGRTP
jgi:queuine tRNA-ribosyltransferase